MPAIEQLMNAPSRGSADNSRKIYILLMLALWYNVYMKNPSPYDFGAEAAMLKEESGSSNPLMKKARGENGQRRERNSVKISRKLKSAHSHSSSAKGGFLEIIVVIIIALVLLNVLGININTILSQPWLKDFALFIWDLLKIVWYDVIQIVAFVKDVASSAATSTPAGN